MIIATASAIVKNLFHMFTGYPTFTVELFLTVELPVTMLLSVTVEPLKTVEWFVTIEWTKTCEWSFRIELLNTILVSAIQLLVSWSKVEDWSIHPLVASFHFTFNLPTNLPINMPINRPINLPINMYTNLHRNRISNTPENPRINFTYPIMPLRYNPIPQFVLQSLHHNLPSICLATCQRTSRRTSQLT